MKRDDDEGDLTAPASPVQGPIIEIVEEPVFTVWASGCPKGQPRARATRVGGFVRMYDPGSADAWKAALAAQVSSAMSKLGLTPYKVSSPLCLGLDFYMPRPKSHLCKSGLRSSAPRHHISKPDIDNLIKTIDCLHGVLFDDDRSVVSVTASKQYADGSDSGVWLSVSIKKSPLLTNASKGLPLRPELKT